MKKKWNTPKMVLISIQSGTILITTEGTNYLRPS